MTATQTPRRRPRVGAVRRFASTQNTGALALLLAAPTAVVWANAPWAGTNEALWRAEIGIHVRGLDLPLETREGVNEGLMALFFVSGLEVRRELDMGERRRVALVVLSALGGMVVPVLLYVAVNTGQPSARGWGIVTGNRHRFRPRRPDPGVGRGRADARVPAHPPRWSPWPNRSTPASTT